MTDLKNQNTKSVKTTNTISTISYIREMALSLKLMAGKANEPMLVYLLDVVEKESLMRLQKCNNLLDQEFGTSETPPPQ